MSVSSTSSGTPRTGRSRGLTDDQLLDRPLVILGAPRSGTSMLGRLLGRHPDLAYLVEPRLTWRWGNDSKSDLLRPSDARPAVRAHLRKCFAQAVRKADRVRLLEKHPSNSLRMGFVDAILPGCVYVHIVRDGVESALSIRRFWQRHSSGLPRKRLADRWREMSLRQAPHYAREALRRVAPPPLRNWLGRPVWGPRLPGLDAMAQELDPLEIACLQWRMCVELACDYGRQLPPERYMEIRLEDMSLDAVGRILQFAGLPPADEVMAGYAEEFDPARTQYHRSAAAPEDAATCRRWLLPTLQWLGYDAG